MKWRKLTAFVQIVFMVFLNVWNVQIVLADDSDIFGNNIAPNVMILLDTSGSMEDPVGTLIAYAPATSYSYQRDDRLQQKDEWKRFWSRKLQQFKSLLHGLCNKLRPKPYPELFGCEQHFGQKCTRIGRVLERINQRDDLQFTLR